MVTVPVTFDVPKEGKEMVDAVTLLIKNAKAGKSKAEIAMAELPALMTAIDGFESIKEEVKSGNRDELAGYAVQQIFDAFDNA